MYFSILSKMEIQTGDNHQLLPKLYNPQEKLTGIDESRNSIQQSAMDSNSINVEQIIQKMQYDENLRNKSHYIIIIKSVSVWMITSSILTCQS